MNLLSHKFRKETGEDMKLLNIEDIKKRVHNWYLGKHIGASSGGGLAVSGHIKRPWLAKIYDLCCKEFKWIITTLIALAFLLIAFIALNRP